MMAAFSSTFRPRLFYKEPRHSFYSESNDEDHFVDCIDKQVDVFDFLEIERDDTSVSLSSSSTTTNSLEISDDISYYSSGSTVYLDALDDSLLSDQEPEICQTENDIPHDSLSLLLAKRTNIDPTLYVVPPAQLTEQSQDHPEEGENKVGRESKEDNPITHAIHFAQNIWQVSKQTPVGFAVNITEDVVGGVLEHLVRLVQHDDNTQPSVEQQLAPFSREYPLGQQAVFTLATEVCTEADNSVDMAIQNRGTPDGSSYLPSDDEDWFPLE